MIAALRPRVWGGRIRRDEDGVALIETAFALPILVILLWMIVQLGLVFRAMSGIQHALGEGARLATIWPTPTLDDIVAEMDDTVYGIGPGDFDIPEPEVGDGYYDLSVTYTQDTDMLLFPGPTITVTRSKRVWVAD